MVKKQLASCLLCSMLPLASVAMGAEEKVENADFSDVYNVTAADNLIVDSIDNKKDNKKATKSKYVYTVPFDGDIEKSHELAFDKLVQDLTSGVMQGSDLKFDVDSVIGDENINDEGLWVKFDVKLVQKMIDDGVVTVWNGLSEPLVGWIVRGSMTKEDASNTVNDPSKQPNDAQIDVGLNDEPSAPAVLLASGSNDEFVEALSSLGNTNKVKFLLPVNDIDDLSVISLQDVLANNAQAIRTASQRYTSGNAVVGLLTTGTDGKLYFSYHVYNLVSGAEVISGDLSGTPTEISDAFLMQLKKHAGMLASLTPPTQSSSTGAENESANNGAVDKQAPGIKDSEHAVIQIFGIEDDDGEIRKVIDALYNAGVLDVVMRPSIGSMFFDLTYPDTYNCVERLAGISILKKRADGLVFDFMSKEEKSDVNGTFGDKSSALNEKNPYNNEGLDSTVPETQELNTENSSTVTKNTETSPTATEPTVTKPTATKKVQRKNGSQRYPDPNSVLHTGGGLGK